MRAERHQPDYILMIAVLMLTGIGVITVYSASTVIDLHSGTSADHYAVRQLEAVVLGLIVYGVVTYTPYHFWFRHAAKFLLGCIGLLLLVLLPGIGHSSNGATRWIGSSSLHIQPSELAVLVLVIYLAFFLTKRLPVLHDTKKAFRPAMVVVFLLTLLVFAEPDMGTAMVIFGTAIVILFASGLRLRPLIVTLAFAIPIGYLGAHVASYRSSRLTSFLHPFSHQSGSGYQLIQGLTAIANGGLTGRGFDASIMATGYLPESWTDFIFAVFTEEWGWLGDLGLLTIFAVLIWRGFHIARFARDRFGSLLAIGMTSTIIIQAAINLGAVTWLLPVTGIPLPFISYGGTDVAINLVAMGVLMSVSRETELTAPVEDAIADVVSVDDFRAVREESKRLFEPPIGDRRAQVTKLSTRRKESYAKPDISQKRTAEKEKTTARRNISLSWRAQQEQASRTTLDKTRPNRNNPRDNRKR